MLKKALIGLVMLIVLLVFIGLILPASVHIERSILVQSTPSSIFPYLSNFKRFNQWSPWALVSNRTQYSFFGPEAGVGARMEWSSPDPAIGEGRQEIVDTEEDRKVRMHLSFGGEKRWDSVLFVSFDLQPQGDHTKVTWGLDKDFGYNLPARYMGLFFENWVGPEYELGLNRLKKLVENKNISHIAE